MCRKVLTKCAGWPHSFNFDEYLNEICINDHKLYQKLETFRYKTNIVKKDTYFQFGFKNTTIRLLLYKQAFLCLNKIYSKIAQYQSIELSKDNACLDFSGLPAIGKYFWDSSLINHNLPILPAGNFDKSLNCSSKAEIVFCKAFLRTHNCHFKFIKSFVSNNGQQFRVDNLSSDLVKQNQIKWSSQCGQALDKLKLDKLLRRVGLL